LLDQAIHGVGRLSSPAAKWFHPGRHPEDTQRYDAKGGDITDGKPVVVLINAGTASASRDCFRRAAEITNAPTITRPDQFGKGSVQTYHPAAVRRWGAAPDHGAVFHPVGPYHPGPRASCPISRWPGR